MLKVIAQDFINPEAVEIVMPLYRELVEKTRQEELCIAYDLFIDQKDPGHFIFIEEWPDRAALDAHCCLSCCWFHGQLSGGQLGKAAAPLLPSVSTEAGDMNTP